MRKTYIGALLKYKPCPLLYSRIVNKKAFEYPSRVYDFWEIFIVGDGGFSFELEGVSKPDTAKSGDIIICPPGCRMTRKALSPFTMHIIQYVFDKPIPPDLFAGGKLRLADHARLNYDLSVLALSPAYTMDMTDTFRCHIMTDIWYIICAELGTLSARSFVSDTPELNRVIRYVNSNIQSRLTLKDVAAKFGFTPVNLLRRFKKEFGVTLTEYVAETRFAKSESLLRETRLPIASIAELCGYASGLYFSACFKKRAGVPPTEYRKQRII